MEGEQVRVIGVIGAMFHTTCEKWQVPVYIYGLKHGPHHPYHPQLDFRGIPPGAQIIAAEVQAGRRCAAGRSVRSSAVCIAHQGRTAGRCSGIADPTSALQGAAALELTSVDSAQQLRNRAGCPAELQRTAEGLAGRPRVQGVLFREKSTRGNSNPNLSLVPEISWG